MRFESILQDIESTLVKLLLILPLKVFIRLEINISNIGQVYAFEINEVSLC